MIDQLLFIITITIAILAGLYAVVVVLAAQLYDLNYARQLHQIAAHPYKAQYRSRPLVTVIITTHNCATTITAQLDAIYRSNYRKLEVLVIDMVSVDDTVKIIRQYQVAHPKRQLRLQAKRTSSPIVKAQQQAFKKYGQGELVLNLPATHKLATHSLGQAVQYYNLIDDQVAIFYLHEQVLVNDSLIGLLQSYETVLRSQLCKALSQLKLISAPAMPKLQTRSGFLASSIKNNTHIAQPVSVRPHYYIATATALTLQKRDIDELLARRFKPQPMVTVDHINGAFSWRFRQVTGRAVLLARPVISLLAALSIGYVLFIALNLHQPAYIGLLIAAFSSYLLLAVWSESQFNFFEKIKTSLLVPVSLGYFALAILARLSGAWCVWRRQPTL